MGKAKGGELLGQPAKRSLNKLVMGRWHATDQQG